MESPKRGALLIFTILALSAIIGGLVGPSLKATAAGADDLQDSIKSFARVLTLVQQNYAEPIDVDKLVYDGAIPGALHMLDPHSYFFDPRQFAKLMEDQRGNYYGVGMRIAPEGDHTVVLSPMMDSPAGRAGIKPGDVITKIDGTAIAGMDSTKVADMLKGPRGTVVNITLSRVGWDKPVVVNVTRDEIPQPALDYAGLVRPGIGYAHLTTFAAEDSAAQLAAAMKKMDFQHLDGFVLDLRGNPGGLITQAIAVSDMFLDKDQLVVSHKGRASSEHRYYSLRGTGGYSVPIVVLMNGGSASASEIVAGAIQDHDRGLITGTQSFGKGLVQTQMPLSDGTAMLLTTAHYFTPSGRLIQRDYKDISLYDYEYSPKPPANPEVKLTDSGRKVLGGGGITPDVPDAAPRFDSFQELLYARNVFYPFDVGVGEFTRYFMGKRPTITKDFDVDDAVLKQFYAFLDQEKIHYTPEEISKNLDWLKGQIKREVFTSAFNVDAGARISVENDAQVSKAVELLPQAKALYVDAKKIVAERMAAQPQLQPRR
ncbi:MAG TPA: S41 family peptidase [Candidatus Acidoferrales bacterium]|nr:S41 family peptidase [Candidatus Acidoferrales bacterium]